MNKNNNNKNVGIITMHKVVNFGSILQAYALQKVILNFGFNCEIIDYKYPNEYHQDINNKPKSWKSYLSRFHKFTKAGRNFRVMEEKIFQFCKKYYCLSERSYESKEDLQKTPPDYNIYVTGSDQVWNTRYVKDDTSFLLDFAPIHAKKISYASSFSSNHLDDKYFQTYKTMLDAYNYISVRELNGASIIKQLINKDAIVTLDPTLLLSANEWCAFKSNLNIKKLGKYILVYLLYYAFDCRTYAYELIKQTQKETGYKVVFIGLRPKEFDKSAETINDVGPIEFLELFNNASFVISSSFHGTAFAINFGIPFFSIINKDNSDDRQYSLLAQLGITNRAIPINKEYSEIDQTFDNISLQRNLCLLRNKSKEYLETALFS